MEFKFQMVWILFSQNRMIVTLARLNEERVSLLCPSYPDKILYYGFWQL